MSWNGQLWGLFTSEVKRLSPAKWAGNRAWYDARLSASRSSDSVVAGVSSMLDDALVILLAGGAGERLYPLTRDRAKPAVFFGGPYRIIDFTLSNCINSGLRRIFIATQYKSLSLNRHIRMGWNIVSEELGEFVEILPPQKRVSEHWYQGTADAVYQNLYSIVQEAPHQVIVLSGDHVYKMDYARMLRFHRERRASMTLAALEVPVAEARRLGVLSVDEADRVTGFIEKPQDPPPIPGSTDVALASMGIYIFDTEVLLRALEADAAQATSHDFGKNIIPTLIQDVPTFAYRFYDENKKASKYWRDIGTLDAYYDANMDLCHVDPEFNLYDPEWPMRTYQPQAPPAKFVFAERGRRCGEALDSVISPGCIVSGSSIIGSVLCPNVRVHSYSTIENSILMPGVRVGRHARIRRAIIDRDVLIPRGAVIGFNAEEDQKRHTVTDQGVVVVTEDDDPLVEPIAEDALRIEGDDDSR
jgi:glucose-1-phosphate adenylyltransferase